MTLIQSNWKNETIFPPNFKDTQRGIFKFGNPNGKRIILTQGNNNFQKNNSIFEYKIPWNGGTQKSNLFQERKPRTEKFPTYHPILINNKENNDHKNTHSIIENNKKEIVKRNYDNTNLSFGKNLKLSNKKEEKKLTKWLPKEITSITPNIKHSINPIKEISFKKSSNKKSIQAKECQIQNPSAVQNANTQKNARINCFPTDSGLSKVSLNNDCSQNRVNLICLYRKENGVKVYFNCYNEEDFNYDEVLKVHPKESEQDDDCQTDDELIQYTRETTLKNLAEDIHNIAYNGPLENQFKNLTRWTKLSK